MSTESPLTYAEQTAIRKLREIADETEKAYLAMHKQLDEASGKCQAFEPYPLEEAVNAHVPSSGSEWDIANYKARLESLHQKSQPIRERNAAVAANNRKLQERFMALVQNAGIPTTVKSLKMAIPTLDCWNQIEDRYKQRLREIAAIEERKQAEKAAEERARAAKEAEVRKAAVVLNLSEKYECQPNAWDVGRELFKRCKYLRLAHYLRKNRGDWSDGPDYARQGLDGFTAESTQDHEILADLWPLVSDWDGDGRVFRDTKWNYDRLFEMVPAELLADYEKWHAVASDD